MLGDLKQEPSVMRTTIDLDPEILSAARQIAADRSISIGKAISELARRGLETRVKSTTRQGFPVFQVPRGARPLTLENVRSDEDDA
jgi:hypothetical protein